MGDGRIRRDKEVQARHHRRGIHERAAIHIQTTAQLSHLELAGDLS
jgi:hypothetical protein